MQHDASRRLVAELQRDARYVVIVAQATGDGTDTFSLAEFADASLVVLELEKTGHSEAADSVRRLDRMHAAVLGAAVLPSISLPRGGGRVATARPDVKHTRNTPGWPTGPQSGRQVSAPPRSPHRRASSRWHPASRP